MDQNKSSLIESLSESSTDNGIFQGYSPKYLTAQICYHTSKFANGFLECLDDLIIVLAQFMVMYSAILLSIYRIHTIEFHHEQTE
jgi:hypothetical protein